MIELARLYNIAEKKKKKKEDPCTLR